MNEESKEPKRKRRGHYLVPCFCLITLVVLTIYGWKQRVPRLNEVGSLVDKHAPNAKDRLARAAWLSDEELICWSSSLALNNAANAEVYRLRIDNKQKTPNVEFNRYLVANPPPHGWFDPGCGPSPDGKWLVTYSVQAKKNATAYTLNLVSSDGKPIQLSRFTNGFLPPVWSRNSSEIIRVEEVNPTTGELRLVLSQVSANKVDRSYPFSFRPGCSLFPMQTLNDGTILAIVDKGHGVVIPWEWVELRRKGSKVIVGPLVIKSPVQTDSDSFCVSPNGDRVAWEVTKDADKQAGILARILRAVGLGGTGSRSEYWVTNRQGENARLIAVDEYTQRTGSLNRWLVFEWSPNGKTLLVSHNDELWTLPVD